MINIFYYDNSRGLADKQKKKIRRILTNDELSQCERFKFKKDREIALISRYMKRKLTSEYLGIIPEKIEFGYTEYHRPFLKRPKIKNFDFNLSHSEKLTVMAISDGRIGVDVEKIMPLDTNIADDYFHEEELKYVNKNKVYRLKNFYKIWTLKESFKKAIGQGLSFPLKNFYFDIKSNDEIMLNIIYSGINGLNWSFKICNLKEDYNMAICKKNSINKFTVIPMVI